MLIISGSSFISIVQPLERGGSTKDLVVADPLVSGSALGFVRGGGSAFFGLGRGAHFIDFGVRSLGWRLWV